MYPLFVFFISFLLFKFSFIFKKFFIMATTPTRIFQFIGGPTFEQLFLNYEGNPGFHELPGTMQRSELVFFSKFQVFKNKTNKTILYFLFLQFSTSDFSLTQQQIGYQGLPKSFVWLTEPGMYLIFLSLLLANRPLHKL